MKSKSRLAYLSAYYLIIYMASGSYSSYISLYYDHLSLDSAQIGLVSSLAAAITILVQPLWGTLADRARTKNIVLSASLIATAAGFWLLPAASAQIAAFMAAVMVFSVFQCGFHPLSDAVALEVAAQEGYAFSTIRMVGSLGYALVALAAGIVFARDITRIFPIYCALLVVAFALSLRLPKVEGHQRRSARKRFWEVLRDKRLRVLYLFALIIQGSLGFLYAFHAIFTRNQGIPTEVLGVGIMIGSLAQFPFMLLYPRITKRVSIPALLLISGVAHALRFFIYAFALGEITFYIAWALHGVCYIVFYLCLADYIATTIAPELRASGQVMNSLVLMGVSKILGGAIGGAAAQWAGLAATFAGAGVLCAAASVWFALMLATPLFKAPPRDEAAGAL